MGGEILSELVPGASSEGFQENLSRLYRLWGKLAEYEVAEVARSKLPRCGARGRKPKLKWASVFRDSSQ
eukprot:7686341-Pyramimonas_sp.AAC.1